MRAFLETMQIVIEHRVKFAMALILAISHLTLPEKAPEYVKLVMEIITD